MSFILQPCWLPVIQSCTSRMVISFSFSFPALFFTCVFLVSTHTTLSFTSDLDTRENRHLDKQLPSLIAPPPHPPCWGAHSLLDAQVSQRRVQEGEGLVCGVGLHLDGQGHWHGDLPLYFDTHPAPWPGALPLCILLICLPLLRWQDFCLIGRQLDFLMSISKTRMEWYIPLCVILGSPQWLLFSLKLLLLVLLLLLQMVSGPLPPPGCWWSKAVSSDDDSLWKVWVCVSLIHTGLRSTLLADISSRCECVLCVTQMWGLLDCQGGDGQMVVFVQWGVCVD